jgi:hypothetical protein
MSEGNCFICKKELSSEEEKINNKHYVLHYPFHVDKCEDCANKTAKLR